jgi:hypothetical protein
MLVSVPDGMTSMSAPNRVNPTAMLVSMLRIITAPVKMAPLQTATAASSSSVRALRRPRFCSARLPSKNRMRGRADTGNRAG